MDYGLSYDRAMTIKDRFWDKVTKTDHCWIWNAAANRAGYGKFAVGGAWVLAHRFSYELHFGGIPAGYFVLHKRKCNTKNCVRPDHLYLGGRSQNALDAIATGNLKHLFPVGDSNPSAVITSDQVGSIRSMLASGITQREIADTFGCSQQLVSAIKHGVARASEV